MPPIAIGLGIAGLGAGVAGSAIQAHAAGNAADIQRQSANQALGLERDIYNQNVSRVQPYINAGYSSLGNLMNQYGGGQNFSNQVAGQLAPFQGAVGMQNIQVPQQPPPQMAPPQQVGYGQTPAAAAGGGLVTVQAPTGEVKQVTPQQAQMYVQRGARILGGGPPSLGGSSLMAGPRSLASLQ